MLKVCRVALVALALLTTTLLSGPAMAGMVATPKAPDAGKAETDTAILKSALQQAGLAPVSADSLIAQLSPEAQTLTVAHLMASQSAGNAVGIVGIAAGVIIVIVIVLSELLWSHGYLTNYDP